MEGEVVAALVGMLPIAFMEPKSLPRELNPFKSQPVESDLLKAHKAKLAEMRFKAASGGK
jgi:hypothetical protein